MKKVIFVGSTPFSGSTFFHMILANDPAGFSCGEVRSLFNPHRAHHVNPQCGCGDENCTIWRQVLEAGVSNLYETIFELFPDVEFVVDSSKNPFWIQSQSERLFERGIQVKNMLIWKTPLEFAYSCKRRNSFEGWDRRWIDYHRLYYSLLEQWRAVKYHAVTSNGTVMEEVCRYLEIPYFEGKERYWEKTHHQLFGNYSARFHLYSGEAAQDLLADTFDQERIQLHRTIYYSEIEDRALQREVEELVGSSETFGNIIGLLEAFDVANESVHGYEAGNVRFPPLSAEYRRARSMLKTQLGRFRYGRRRRS